jgi:hypothetical protein
LDRTDYSLTDLTLGRAASFHHVAAGGMESNHVTITIPSIGIVARQWSMVILSNGFFALDLHGRLTVQVSQEAAAPGPGREVLAGRTEK